MNNVLKTSLIVLVVLAVAAGLFLAGSLFGSFWMQRAFAGSSTMMGWNGTGPGNMMGGYGGRNSGGAGPGGMMGGRNGGGAGPGGMMDGRGGRYGGGMMGGYGNGAQVNTTPLTVDEAKKAAQDYVTALKIDGLEIGEVMVFDNNAYVVVKESATGLGAFELLVDPLSKTAYPEHGPDMMWNQKYGGVIVSGMMGRYGHGGMMQGWNGQNATPGANATPANVPAEMSVSVADAVKAAQAYLDQAYPGATAASDPVQFYGYYTLDFTKDGKVVGMLSVNGYNSQVFPHTWHGTFIEESK